MVATVATVAMVAPGVWAQQSPTGLPAAGAQGPGPQQQVMPEGDPFDGDDEDMQSIWAKLCGETQDPTDEDSRVNICTTQFEILNREANPVMVGAITKVDGQEQELFSITVPQGPQGIAIRAGVRVQVDEGEVIPLRYTFCFMHGCMAEVPASDDLVDKLKQGENITIALVDAAGNVLSLPVPLQGFAMAYEGDAVDAERYVALRRQMIEDYRRSQTEDDNADSTN